ncbi:hypothetical protein NMY22_g12249 [Coprinellus aureogranulatus]|nr:hypothetical protein NMY22_g12249 [Coprinellus aureogranulatus]
MIIGSLIRRILTIPGKLICGSMCQKREKGSASYRSKNDLNKNIWKLFISTAGPVAALRMDDGQRTRTDGAMLMDQLMAADTGPGGTGYGTATIKFGFDSGFSIGARRRGFRFYHHLQMLDNASITTMPLDSAETMGSSSPADREPREPSVTGSPSQQSQRDVESDSERPLPFEGAPYGIGVVHMYAVYIIELVCEKATGWRMSKSKADGKQGECNIPLKYRAELEALAAQIVRAWSNRVKLPFSLVEVHDALKSAGSAPRDQLLREKFAAGYPRTASGSFPLVDQPTVFLDSEDLVVAWSDPPMKVALFHAVEEYGEGVLEMGGETWRADRETFAKPEKCVVSPGAANFSPCWYPQGRNRKNCLPGPSATLKTPQGRKMLRAVKSTLAIIGALFAVIHPESYNQQMQAFVRMHNDLEKHTAESKLTKDLMELWCSPFNAFAMICNRETESHRDNRGGAYCLDILGTFGTYLGGRLEVPLLGRRFVYNPGTAFSLPGYLFEHAASKTTGERICLANFIRPAVGKGVLGDEWKDILPPKAESLMRAIGLKRPQVDDKDIWV